MLVHPLLKAQWICVSAAGTVISERGASSQPRSAEALNLLPPLIGSSRI